MIIKYNGPSEQKCTVEGDRLAILRIAPELILGFTWSNKIHRFFCAENYLPQSAEIIRIGVSGQAFSMVLRHAAFNPLKVGDPIPFVQPPVFHKIY